jgi:predicted RNA-binding Zn ribbon-like protein
MSNLPPKSRITRVQGRDRNQSSLLGDALCLDFVNTVDDRTGRHATDNLTTYADLVRWAWHAWLIEDDQRDILLATGTTTIDERDALFTQAIALREAIYRIFAAVIAGSSPATADLAILQRVYLAALAEAHLALRDDLFAWEWANDDTSGKLDSLLWPIAQSAVELLTSPQVHRVRQCPGCDDCGWLFLDISKNGTRRWCSMEGCGSRAKMRRLYARRTSK